MLVEQRGGVEVLDHQCPGGLSTPERAHYHKTQSLIETKTKTIINYQIQSSFLSNIIISSFAGVAQSGTAWDC